MWRHQSRRTWAPQQGQPSHRSQETWTHSPAEPHRTSGYATGRATKVEIIKRASECFSEQGFHGTSLRSIARSAGVDHSTLIHHFGNKANLLRVMLEWHDGHGMTTAPKLPVTAWELIDGMTQMASYNQTVPGLVQLHSMLSVEAANPDHRIRPLVVRFSENRSGPEGVG